MQGIPILNEQFSVCLNNKCFSKNIRTKFANISNASKDYQAKIDAALNSDDKNDASKLKLMQDDRSLEILGTEAFLAELLNYKPHGPHGNKLFNNFVLNTAMKQLSIIEPTFKSYMCTLVDFVKGSKFNAGDDCLDNLMHDNFDYLTYGCILNTLTSSGASKGEVGHWVAFFIDLRTEPITVEYYNSTGNNAPKEIFVWMESLAKHISEKTNRAAKAINVSNVRSQSGPSECGIYSFHYIVCRLYGIDYKQFRADKIPDKEIQKLRKLFFNDQNDLGAKITKELKSRIMI